MKTTLKKHECHVYTLFAVRHRPLFYDSFVFLETYFKTTGIRIKIWGQTVPYGKVSQNRFLFVPNCEQGGYSCKCVCGVSTDFCYKSIASSVLFFLMMMEKGLQKVHRPLRKPANLVGSIWVRYVVIIAVQYWGLSRANGCCCCCCWGSGRHFALDIGHLVGPLNYRRCDTKRRLPCTITPFY